MIDDINGGSLVGVCLGFPRKFILVGEPIRNRNEKITRVTFFTIGRNKCESDSLAVFFCYGSTLPNFCMKSIGATVKVTWNIVGEIISGENVVGPFK